MNKVIRKEKVLKTLADKVGLSDQDIAWFTKAVDPFHDVPIEHLRGYPDGANTNSVVQTCKKSFTIERSALLPTAPNTTWGFMLRLDDHQVKEDAIQAQIRSQHCNLGDYNSQRMQYGGITQTQFTSTTNQPLYAGQSGSGPYNNVIVNGLDTLTEDMYIKGRSRVIARGFEVHNTTSELYKQGTFTTFQMPSTQQSESVYTYEAAVSVAEEKVETKSKKQIVKDPSLPGNFNALGNKNSRLVQAPPHSVGAAVVLPGSLQWEAKEGCMMVQKMNSMENDFTYRDFNSVIILPDETLFPTNLAISPINVYTPVPLAVDSSVPYEITEKTSWAASDGALNDSALALFETNKRIPYTSMGVIASGLSDQSTFTVNWVEVIERCPSWSELDIIVLASPTPKRSDAVIRLYTLIMSELPTAVPVRMNGFGDWFLGIVDSVVNTIGSIGKPLLGAVKGYQDTRQQDSQPSQIQTYVQAPNRIQNLEPPRHKPLPMPPRKIVVQEVRKPLPPTPQRKKPQPPPKPRK